MGHDVADSRTGGKRGGARLDRATEAVGPLDLTETLLGEPGPACEGQVRDWALVLTARGVPHVLRRQGLGWRLLVPRARAEEALAELQAYLAERAARPLLDPEAVPARPPVWPRVLAVVGLLTAVGGFLVGGVAPFGRHIPWRQLGLGDSTAMLDGQWWRAVTALTLHADPAHLLGNAVCGALFLCLLCRETGLGLGFALCLFSGVLGNVEKALVQGPGLLFLGASTAVFGALGGLAGIRLLNRRGGLLRSPAAPIGAGLMLLAMLGAGSDEGGNVDLAGHLFGFVSGVLLGLGVGLRLRRQGPPGPVRQTLAGVLALALPLAAWGLAFGARPGP